jgi:ubiquinone/menaquinone biosynthesis C-methylase UbiE
MTIQTSRQFYDRISGAYDAIADGGEHKARERGLAVLAVQPGEQVLEIGYGTGHSLVALATAAGASGHVDGIDISDGMCKVATKRVTDAGVADRVDLRVGDVPPLPYDDARFDVVSMSFTLELFPLEVIPQVLAEIRRVLKPGGRLGVVSMATVKPGANDSSLEITYKWMHHHFPHIVDCQPIAAEDLIADSGLTIRHQERLSLFTMPVAVVVAGK